MAEVLYHPHGRVPRHTHDLTGLAVVVDGGYRKRVEAKDHECGPGTLTLEPPGVAHGEIYGRSEVRAVLIEVLPWRLPAVVDELTGVVAPVCMSHSAVRTLGRRARRELRASDSASSLVLESVALELMAIAGRSTWRPRLAPAWLRLVTERLRDDFGSQPDLRTLADGAGVHPAHLARAFRTHEGCTVGEYLRQRRIEWAAGQLEHTDRSLASIAHSAGFCDQSHFTRVFVHRTGMTPGAYRCATRTTRRGTEPRETS